jgi:hypothetical protein
MLVQQVEKGQNVIHSLAAKYSQIPGAQIFAGRDPWCAGAAAQDFGGLPRAAKVRRVNGFNRMICQTLRGFRRFLQPLIVQRDV